jgi:hypothetical protein
MKQVKVILKKPCCIDNVWRKIGEELIIDFETLQQGMLSNCFTIVNEDIVKEIIEEIPSKVSIEKKSLSDDEIIENLCNIDHVTLDIAQKLLELGITNASEIVKKQNLLTKLKNYKKIIESAKSWIEEDNNG